jgi:hypothetical protein
MLMKSTVVLTRSIIAGIQIADLYSSKLGTTLRVTLRNGGMKEIPLPFELQSLIYQKVASFGEDLILMLHSRLHGVAMPEETNPAEPATAVSSVGTHSKKTS